MQSQDGREKVRTMLARNLLTFPWLIDQLAREGVSTCASEISSGISGKRKGPKVDRVIEKSLLVLERYESCLRR
jgi:hypothetical protein